MKLQGIRNGLDAFETGEVLEERLAGAGHEDPMTWVAQQLEQGGVRVAGAGGQNNPTRINVISWVAKIVGDGPAGRFQPKRSRLIPHAPRVGERFQQPRRIRKTDQGGIRLGEVGYIDPLAAQTTPRSGQPIRRKGLWYAR